MRSPNAPRHKTALLAVTFALSFAALAGCLSAPDGGSTLYVKDALTDDVSEVYVTFTKAQVKQADDGWVTVYDGKATIELLSLSAADARERLASFDLAPGQYDGLRLAVSEVTVVYHDGNESLLNVFGNVVGVAENFTVGPDGIDILVDFDLEAGVDLEAGTYTPVVADVQTSDDDSDGDGIDDVRDRDDDDDGIEDDEDEDNDGDGHDDAPRQHYGATIVELCAAERDEETADAQEDLDEELREAAFERDEELAEAEDRDDRAKAWGEYNETVAEARSEYDEEVADALDDHDECLVEDDRSGRSHDEDDDHDGDDHGGDRDDESDDHESDDHDEHDEDDHDDRDGNETDEDRSGSDSGSDHDEYDEADEEDDSDARDEEDSSGSGSGDEVDDESDSS